MYSFPLFHVLIFKVLHIHLLSSLSSTWYLSMYVMIFQWWWLPFRMLALGLLPSPLMRRIVLTILTAGPSRKPSIWMRSGWVSIKKDSPSTSSSNIRDPASSLPRTEVTKSETCRGFHPSTFLLSSGSCPRGPPADVSLDLSGSTFFFQLRAL